MKEIRAAITSKGQVTIPAELRRHLGLKPGDEVTFVLLASGKVELKAPKYPTIASLAGAAGTLDLPRAFDEMLEIARDDALEREYHDNT